MRKIYSLATAVIVSLAISASAFAPRLATEAPSVRFASESVPFTQVSVGNNNQSAAVRAPRPVVVDPALTSIAKLQEADASITPQADEETWEDMGEATITEGILDSFYPQYAGVKWNVKVQKSTTTEGLYRIPNVYNENCPFANGGVEGDPMIIHAEDSTKVYFEKMATGLSLDYGAITISSLAQYYMDSYGLSLDDCSEYDVLGTMEDGVITFPNSTLVIYQESYNSNGAYIGNGNGLFKIVMPGGKDYSTRLAIDKYCFDGTATVNVDGGDAGTLKLYVTEGEYNEVEFLNLPAYALSHGDVVEPGEVTFSLGDSKVMTAMLVSADAEGTLKQFSYCHVYNYPADDADDWESLGNASYTDDLFSSIYTYIYTDTWDVEIQENKTKAGYYRLVNPYSASASIFADVLDYFTFDDDHNHYIYINAEDPENIYIETSPLGADYGSGESRISSWVYYYLSDGYSLSTIKTVFDADGIDVFGGLDESTNTITFPASVLSFSESGYANGEWSDANENEGTAIVLPASAAIGKIAIDESATAPAEYFNLQGIRVDNPENGVYIMRQGSKVSKVYKK